ncbi:hypothetical protein [Bacteroides sp. OM05-12]|uniref:hypothetical protein n=1 Tax=Bacteroides sp. OM05-12 TaxID=2292283 RepID=UPI001F1FE8B6|nr:hypothetical protein [Bacteroides sp. OM05-12]
MQRREVFGLSQPCKVTDNAIEEYRYQHIRQQAQRIQANEQRRTEWVTKGYAPGDALDNEVGECDFF